MKFQKRLFTILLILSICLFSMTAEKPSNKKSKKDKKEKTPKIEIVEPSIDEVFVKSLNDLKIEFTKNPAEVIIGNAFASGFEVKVTNYDDEPLNNISITFEYPESKNKQEITYGKQEISTDENGIATLNLPKLEFACKDSIIAYPTPVSDIETTIEAAKSKAVKSPVKVKSEFTKNGIILFVYDHDTRNKPTNNFYPILANFQKNGARKVGNAPVIEPKYIGENPAKLAEMNREMVGNTYKYLVGGTIKYIKPTEKVDDGYACEMIAEIYVVDLKTGVELYRNEFTDTGFGKSWGQDATDCKNKLAKTIVEDIIYNM